MAVNRRTRDEILIRGLNKADCPTLDQHDRPHGVIVPNAHCLDWLQDALDYIYEVFPWGGLITSGALSLTTAGTVSVPSDFAIDVRDGLSLDSTQVRLARIDGQEAVSRRVLAETGDPCYYYVQGSTLYYFPVPTSTLAATLYYHQLPSELGANDVPHFPSALILTEYIRLRAFEYVRAMAPGTADTYLEAQAAKFKRAGLAGEPETTTLPFDGRYFRASAETDLSYTWMGNQ